MGKAEGSWGCRLRTPAPRFPLFSRAWLGSFEVGVLSGAAVLLVFWIPEVAAAPPASLALSRPCNKRPKKTKSPKSPKPSPNVRGKVELSFSRFWRRACIFLASSRDGSGLRWSLNPGESRAEFPSSIFLGKLVCLTVITSPLAVFKRRSEEINPLKKLIVFVVIALSTNITT